MSIDKIIVNIAGVLAIFFTYWFFFMKKDTVTSVNDGVVIKVDGGYKPSSIEIARGKKTTITFLRKDPSSCLEEVVLPDFKIKKYLPLNQEVTISLTPERSGEFPFSCGMGMFHGKVLVK